MLPAREFPLDDAGPRAGSAAAGASCSRATRPRSASTATCRTACRRPGIEYYLPLFFDRLATLFDYLPARHHAGRCTTTSASAVQEFWRDANSRYKIAGGDPDRPLLPPPQLFVPAEEFYVRRAGLPAHRSCCDEAGRESRPAQRRAAARRSRSTGARDDPLAALKQLPRDLGAARADRRRVARPARDHGELLRRVRPQARRRAPVRGFHAEIRAVHARRVAALPRLRRARREGWAVVTEAELYAGVVRRRGARRREAQLGRRHAARPLRAQDRRAGGARAAWHRPLPGPDQPERRRGQHANSCCSSTRAATSSTCRSSQLGVIGRYSGAQPEEAPLHKLGSGQWDKAKARAAKQVRDTAAELLALYAKRAARLGHAFAHPAARPRGVRRRLRLRGDARPGRGDRGGDHRHGGRQADGPPGVRRRRLRQDRGRAARRVRRGRRQQAGGDPLPDHAARRAAFPDLHRPLRRLAGEDRGAVPLPQLPRSPRRPSSKLESGEIDIVIGTHKLLSRDVKLKRLGLVIIDEEHRFGVRQKEALKKLRAEVDVLTLTATPIPRTLAMSLEGIRDFSVIATAPQKRLAIKTFVAPWSEGLIREAVMRELRRGGQVYFLHNEVDTHRAHARAAGEAAARGAHRGGARPDARARARARDARLHRAALQRAAVLDHHRDRHRHPAPPTPSSSTAPTSSAWRSCTSCAAASAARTTRPTPTC